MEDSKKVWKKKGQDKKERGGQEKKEVEEKIENLGEAGTGQSARRISPLPGEHP
jgi:hypothetical protein